LFKDIIFLTATNRDAGYHKRHEILSSSTSPEKLNSAQRKSDSVIFAAILDCETVAVRATGEFLGAGSV